MKKLAQHALTTLALLALGRSIKKLKKHYR
jgi:hypothetical protein